MLLSRAPSMTVRPVGTSTSCLVPLCSIYVILAMLAASSFQRYRLSSDRLGIKPEASGNFAGKSCRNHHAFYICSHAESPATLAPPSSRLAATALGAGGRAALYATHRGAGDGGGAGDPAPKARHGQGCDLSDP